ncbi:MAG TPA: leucine/isoleucine/valine transporter permease subunit [Anaerolineae bacterium]|nr:leucine/isoleucine/valine transporter permease subunit [Anaerolineae bacterium]
MKRTSPFSWMTPVTTGLIGGVVALFLCLVGIVEASLGRYVITGIVTMGQVFVLAVYAIFAMQAAQKAAPGQDEKPAPVRTLASGAISGLMISVVLAIFVLLGQQIDLRAVFIHATPVLYDLLTFGLGVPQGIFVLLGFGILMGVLFGAMALLPSALRRSLGAGLIAVPLVAVIYSSLFSGRGLSAFQALAVFVVVGLALFLWGRYQQPVRARANALPARQQRSMRLGLWVVAILFVLALPALGTYPSEVLVITGIFVLMGLGLNIVVGYAGLLDLGYVAFFAIGAYVMAILTSPEITWFPFSGNFWIALPFAVLAATLAGVILGIPVLNMRGDYLAIVTLGFGEIIRLVALSDWLKPLIGGSNGITQIPKPVVFGFSFDNPQKLYYIVVIGCVIAAFIATRLKYSRLGRNWMAIREDEDVAQAMGIDLVRNKLMAFATGAALSGLAGALFATKLTSIYPHSFNLLVSINVLAVIIVGGLGSIPGVIIGAVALVGLPELLREFAEYRLLVYGAVLVFMMLKRPEGLLPEARRKLELHELSPDVAE